MSNPMQTGDGVGFVTGAVKDFVSALKGGKNKKRQDEFSEAKSAHELLLKHQEAEHSHASSEAEKNRTHQKDLITHVVSTMAGRAGTLKSEGGRIELYSPAKKATTPRKPKSPVETAAPASRRTTLKATPRSTQGKFAPIKQATNPARVRKVK